MTSSQALSNTIVDFEVYDAANLMVYHTHKDGLTFAANSPRAISATWLVPSGQAPGVYSVKVLVFGPSWTPLYGSYYQCASFTVRAAAATLTATRTPATSGTATATSTGTAATPTATRTPTRTAAATPTRPAATPTRTPTRTVATATRTATRTPTSTAAAPTATPTEVAPATSSGWGFVTRSGSQLYADGAPFRFSGANIPWLGLEATGGGSYPTPYRIDDALATAQAMGATVVRAWTLGMSVGCPNCLEPRLNSFNDAAFAPIDYALASARAHHVRLLIPLVDNWPYYSGSKHTFVAWRGLSDDAFFSDATVRADFEAYIRHLLTHVNPYTGLALKDDPTVLAWETGNEVNRTDYKWGATEVGWTQAIAGYLKALAPRQLVADGHSGSARNSGLVAAADLGLSAVDLYSSHYYPLRLGFLQQDAAAVAAAGKAYFVGEYDWTGRGAILSQDTAAAANGGAAAAINVTFGIAYKNNGYVNLSQSGLALQPGATYTLSFAAKASAASTFNVRVSTAGCATTTAWSTLTPPVEAGDVLTKTVTLGTSWPSSPFSYSFTVPASAGSGPYTLCFENLGQDTGKQIWWDAVSLTNTANSTVNLVQNGSFETAGPATDDQRGTDALAAWTFTVNTAGDSLASFHAAIENPASGVSGDLYWSLFPHDDRDGYKQGDNFSLHFPGDTAEMRSRVQQLRAHAYLMSGLAVPPAAAPAAPLLHDVTAVASGERVDWRGAAGAGSYTVERSPDGVTWTQVASGLSDQQSPWTDTSASPGVVYSYRVRAVAPSGAVSPPSNSEVAPGNLLQNASFEHDGLYWADPWNLVVQGGAGGALAQDTTAAQDGTAAADIDVTRANASYPYYVQLAQKGISLTGGRSYPLSFWAKASAPRSIEVIVQQVATGKLYFKQAVSLGTGWRQYSFTFTPPASDRNAAFAFNLAQSTGHVWLDNVTLQAYTPPATPTSAPPSPTDTATPSPTTTPTPIGTSTPTPTPTDTDTPTPTAVPAILVASSANGGYHDTTTVTGTNFSPGEGIKVYWDSTGATPLFAGTADATGTFVATLSVPDAGLGSHTIIAAGQTSGQTARAPFTVAPKTILSHIGGTSGTQIVIQGHGFGANEAARVYWGTLGGPLLGTATTFGSGAFSGPQAITFTVPLSATGIYNVVSVGQSTGAVYTTTFTLNPSLSITPNSGVSSAASMSAAGTGFGANETVTLKWNCAYRTCSSTAVLGTAVTDANGAFSGVRVTPPAGVPAGTYPIGAIGGKSAAFVTTTVTVASS